MTFFNPTTWLRHYLYSLYLQHSVTIDTPTSSYANFLRTLYLFLALSQGSYFHEIALINHHGLWAFYYQPWKRLHFIHSQQHFNCNLMTTNKKQSLPLPVFPDLDHDSRPNDLSIPPWMLKYSEL